MAGKRVAIIGAGPSGLSVLNAFRTAERQGWTIPDLVCFEKQSAAGGLWNYTWRTGLDAFGEPLPNSMYRYLWSNGPKECLELADFTFMEHFKKEIPSFPPREVLRDYFLGRAKKADVFAYLRLNTIVRRVETVDADNSFLVTSFDMISGKTNAEKFDYVIVASGHFSCPYVPSFPGLDSFPGRIMHAHDFREAREFSGKHVLIIGSSYSAEDLALQCHKYGAAHVTCSYRSKPMGFKWPDGMEELPLLTKIKNNVAFFTDGSSREVDAIIFCTGYQHVFPFLPDELRLCTGNILYPGKLYKGIFWYRNPKLMYIGMQDQYYTFSMFDAQAWYARDYILGKIMLPSEEEQEADMTSWYERGQLLKSCVDDINFQTDYIKDLLKETDYPKHDIDLQCNHFHDWEHDKDENILTYREKCFKSACTGHMAPPHHTKWLQAMDDSLEEFLKTIP